MPLSLLLIVVGIMIAFLVNHALGVVLLAIGLIILAAEYFAGRWRL